MKLRPQSDTLTRLKAQRETLAAKLAIVTQRLQADTDDVTELVTWLDEKQTLESALTMLDRRIDAEEVAQRSQLTAEQEAKRLAELVTEQKEYGANLQAVVKDVLRLDASLQALVASYRRLALLGAMGAGDTVLSLAPAVQRALFALQFTAPELLGLPARNPDAERRADAIDDATARLERAERRRDGLKEFARQGYTVRGVDFDAANDDVKTAKRQLALASGQPWTAQDEAQAERSEGLVFTMKSPAELEESLRRQSHAAAVAPPPTYAPTRRR